MIVVIYGFFTKHFSSDTTEQKSSPAAFKSTFASSLASPPAPRERTTSKSKSSCLPPLPTSPPPPLPCEPPPPLPSAPPLPRSASKSFTVSTKSKLSSQYNGKSSAGCKISSSQKGAVKFNFGLGKNTTAVGFVKPRVPVKNSNVFGDDESENENESGNSSADEVESEPELITSSKEEQQTCLTKAIDYFDTLINSEKKRKIIRFVRGSDSAGILPGTVNDTKSDAQPLSSIISGR